ncbi:Pentatricopeptide repeat [Cinnamomum micranthum f. kanehirae]|uniref:Pentatricopeptide repeat n=1 Tax=Cinnamomum micranthum f. kanehirae TaxID=337451 RepID=A0A443PST4_9MAGN|nr:Pentatricopeptide repeat [Cinnamomum micranthum f. kanehirae]
MIAGYAHQERFVEVIDCFLQMYHDGMRPDVSTILSLLTSCAHSKAILQWKLFYSRGIREGYDSNVLVINTLIAMYSKCGDLVSAQLLFDTMPNRTCVSWTAMIDGYAKVGDVDKAMNLFSAMSDEKPDAVTVVAMLSACSQTGTIEIGQWMHKYACDSRIFDIMHERTVVSWTTIIGGYSMNGEFEGALTLFPQMMKSGYKPNHLTLLAILQACTHAGFLEKGWGYFNFMIKVYQIRPTLEHCACMADLLGRKGKLKEAFKFIQNMPVKPDAGV